VTKIFNNETKLPLIRDEIEVDNYAEIVIIDLINGSEIVIDKTLAWDSQLGSQLQWSNQDNLVYYNTFDENYHVQGVMYDINRNVKQHLTCPIYHVSYSGKYSIRYNLHLYILSYYFNVYTCFSPNLGKIQYTQQGYGVYVPSVNVQRNYLLKLLKVKITF
jgi:hypothetical protein